MENNIITNKIFKIYLLGMFTATFVIVEITVAHSAFEIASNLQNGTLIKSILTIWEKD